MHPLRAGARPSPAARNSVGTHTDHLPNFGPPKVAWRDRFTDDFVHVVLKVVDVSDRVCPGEWPVPNAMKPDALEDLSVREGFFALAV